MPKPSLLKYSRYILAISGAAANVLNGGRAGASSNFSRAIMFTFRLISLEKV